MKQNEKITLVAPSEEYEADVMAYRDEFFAAGENRIYGSAGLHHFTDYGEWLTKTREQTDTREDSALVPQSTFLTYADGRLVGIISVRHRLNDYLRAYGGHIGYAVRPSERGRGYGTAQLRLALDEAKKLELERVMIACSDDNPASAGVIENCGGVLEKVSYFEPENETVRIYWISLK